MAYKKEYIYDYIKKERYVHLSEFKNVITKMKMMCPEGHKFEMTFWNFKHNHRCPICAKIKRAKSNEKYTEEYVKQTLEKEEYSLLSPYEKSYSKNIIVSCPDEKHPPFKTTFTRFLIGSRCKMCYHQNKAGKYCLKTWKELEEIINVEGYKLLPSEYKNQHTNLNIQCPKGHIFKMRYGNFREGQRCPICNSMEQKSSQEREVLEYVKSIYNGVIIENDRTTIFNKTNKRKYGLELDIWIPEKRVAIEFNGVYWHSIPSKKKTDSIKISECNKNGIILLIVTDLEWKNNNEDVKEKIKKLLVYQ